MEKFNETFEMLVADIENIVDLPASQQSAIKWLQKSVRYNVPFFSQFRGIVVPVTYKALVPNATEKDLMLSNILGWIYQIHQQYIIMMDDIADNSTTRFGQAAWHTLKETGNHAINDTALMEHLAYKLLRKYFGHLGNKYHTLLDLLLQVSFQTLMGQTVEMSTTWKQTPENFTMEFWYQKTQTKSGYAMYFLSFKMAVILAGFTEKEENDDLLQIFDEITFDLAKIIQLQDDFLDSFTCDFTDDIRNGTCNWVFLKAMDLCNIEQLKVLKDNYGEDDTKKINFVKEIYEEVNVESEFKKTEKEWIEKLILKVSKLPPEAKGFGDAVFFTLKQLCNCVEKDHWN